MTKGGGIVTKVHLEPFAGLLGVWTPPSPSIVHVNIEIGRMALKVESYGQFGDFDYGWKIKWLSFFKPIFLKI